MNPIKFAQMMKYLTRAKKVDPNLPKVTTADKIEIPPKKQTVEEMEAINEFMRRNPRVEKAGGGMLVQPSADGSRPGYGGKRKTSTEGLPQFVTTDELNPGKYTVRVAGSNLNEPFFKTNLSLEEATKISKKYKPAYTIDTDLLTQLIDQANNSNKIYSKEDIMEMYAKKKKTVGTTKRRTKTGFLNYPKIKTKTFDSAGTLLPAEKKVERVLQEILSMNKAVPDVDLGVRNKNLSNYKKYIMKETGIGQNNLSNILKTLPDYKNNLESFKYLENSGLWKTDLVDMSLSDQLKFAFEAKDGKPRYKNIGYLVGDPNYVTMDFALRNWNLNKGKGKIKFYDTNGNIIKWKNGLELPVTKVSFSYEGNRFGIGKKDKALNLRLVGKTYFPEVYQNLDYINTLKSTMVDNPYKPGKQISFLDLMKRVYIKDKGYKVGAPLFSIFHGEGGVGKEPFKNLSFGMQDLNQALYKIEKTIPLKGLRKKIINQAVGNLKGLGGEDLIKAIINQQSIIAQEAAKGNLPIGTVRERAMLQTLKAENLGPKEKIFLKNRIASLGGGKCKTRGFLNQGGRVGLQDGTPSVDVCFRNGLERIRKGGVDFTRAEAMNFNNLTKGLRAIGASNIMKLGVIPEVLFEGALIANKMASEGDSFAQGLRSSYLAVPFQAMGLAKTYEEGRRDEILAAAPESQRGKILDVMNLQDTLNKRNELVAQSQNLKSQIEDTDRISDGSFGYVGDSQDLQKKLFETRADLQDLYRGDAGRAERMLTTKPIDLNIRDQLTMDAYKSAVEKADVDRASNILFAPGAGLGVDTQIKKRMKDMKALYPQLKDANLSNERIDEILKEQNVFSPFTLGFGMQQMQPGIGDTKYNEDVAYQEIRDLINQAVDEDIQSQQFQNIADAGGIANLAGGGIAGLSGGVDQGPQRTSMNPDSQGLQGLMKRGIKG